ncbi:hypothetical protein GUITHDRAFT_107564 [Guillardia theta CCMP2712]|uniref:Uncharacterized protein n=1 Tax=Guillardia theta (strain CCMP2712) TaxID=905079 RepID=L1JFD7_GUITC|nr:hypothetical protein GUITHDRAFT_107564 [Guillardia theta CCMP2712]EKX46790.1 hypothetical protein GUITHDRAFT_107564 [Guillardia theta CCMP2712]|eukprot:XP_005833770.1 hypothetical protein GUITHDRAFT_107564 [Guillardia theta CCMP2712]
MRWRQRKIEVQQRKAPDLESPAAHRPPLPPPLPLPLPPSKHAASLESLYASALEGRTEVMRLLIEDDVDVQGRNRQGLQALHAAAVSGHAECLKLLLASHANPNAKTNDGRTGLALSAMMGHVSCLDVLLEEGADPQLCDAMGFTPVNCAVMSGRVEAVRFLAARMSADRSEQEQDSARRREEVDCKFAALM